MRPIVIVSGILGGGSALVFAAAAVVASVFPTGALIPNQGWNNRMVMFDGPAVRGPLVFRADPMDIDDTSGGWTGGAIEPGTDVLVQLPEGGEVR